MLKKRSFWVGFLAGGLVIFFYSWFSIWATYTALEAQSKARESELRQIKRIIFSVEKIEQERADIIEWNQRMKKPKPNEVIVATDNE